MNRFWIQRMVFFVLLGLILLGPIVTAPRLMAQGGEENTGEKETSVQQKPQSPMEFFITFSRAQLQGSGFNRHGLEVNGQPFVWWEQGDGPTSLIFLHGVADQAGTWFQVASGLAKGYRVVLVDLPGHGESGPSEGPLPMSTVMDGFAAWLTAHGVQDGAPVVLVGNSMGAWVATSTAARLPDHVARVVAVNGGPLRADTGDLNLLPQNRDEARRLMAALRDPASTPTPDPVLDDLVRRAKDGEVSRMFAAQDDLESHLMEDGLESITTPVDILWGKSDRYLGQDYATRLEAELPQARLTWLEKCGHLPQAECPLAFSANLRRLLEQAAPGEERESGDEAEAKDDSGDGDHG